MAAGPVSLEIKSTDRLGLPETSDLVAFFPIAAFLEDFNAFEALQDAPLGTDGSAAFQTVVL